MLKIILIAVFLNILPDEYHCQHPFGPTVVATEGQIWPKPQKQERFVDYFYVTKEDFKFKVINKSCDILEKSIKYYFKIIFTSVQKNVTGSNKYQKLKRLEINLKKACRDIEYPSLEMDEKYTLVVTKEKSTLEASSIWGILRGLETFSQIIHQDKYNSILKLQSTKIVDFPRFPHRGLMLDTSRHFISPNLILKIIEAMAFNKMNVFHWHMVDDQSFPYESKTFPNLSKVGAYVPWQTYPQSEIKNIVEYSRLRGIRVIPEFDSPAHTSSWQGEPEILTQCPEKNEFIVDPTKKETFTFLEKFYKEITELFPDNYLHIGGDEVDTTCWTSNPKIRKFIKDHKINKHYYALGHYYIERLLEILDPKHKKKIVWQDAFLNNAPLPNTTVIQIWRRGKYFNEDDTGHTLLKEVILNGFQSILSACWYLDHIVRGDDFYHLYQCDPHNITATKMEKKLILGGEGCMWSEFVDDSNVVSRVWPRASAIAEKLWSAYTADYENVEKRIEEHTCRMKQRGISAEPPNGAGFCPMKMKSSEYLK